MPFHGGLDWGSASHAVCVINETGQVVTRIEVRHDADGLAGMLARLKRIAPPAELPIAIERPSSLIVEALVAAGYPVIPIHPNARQSLPAPLPCRWQQKRSGRRLHAGRHPSAPTGIVSAP